MQVGHLLVMILSYDRFLSITKDHLGSLTEPWRVDGKTFEGNTAGPGPQTPLSRTVSRRPSKGQHLGTWQ
ncbi:hypothetical protein CEP51_002722 [Fusarium floridanum]|uniref:Uncharacterized protein n=1 Tax=Fusarium floridanum TaxID=1325733 RepID=A0A428SA26_9HYPO|nr:hypothetical protein CEP51_002722 [Fusarium floridanum]